MNVSVDMSARKIAGRLVLVLALALGLGQLLGVGETKPSPVRQQTRQADAVKLQPPEDLHITKGPNGTMSLPLLPDRNVVIKREGTGPGRDYVPPSDEAIKLLVAAHGPDLAKVFAQETGWEPIAQTGPTGEQGFVNLDDLYFREEQQVVNAHGTLLGYDSPFIGFETPEKYIARKNAHLSH